ncbi:MAG TPA: hypothetical protein VHG10_01465 [Glycomyces sp.]|nr:hypothetical protein [Glycomyces sp.]
MTSPVPAGRLDPVAAQPGVAAGDVTFTARTPLADGAIEGHSWVTAELTGAAVDGRASTGPARPAEIVLTTPTADAARPAVGGPKAVPTPTGTTPTGGPASWRPSR